MMEQSAYRIIDANFNRAREALRTVEEYCRFTLGSQPLSARAKQLRHELSSLINTMDSRVLLSARDSDRDVGLGITVQSRLERSDLSDCLTAGCKRLGEALRVLTEVTAIENGPISSQLERLRFGAYTLEKDIALFSEPAQKYAAVRLYVVITSSQREQILSLARKCAAGGADCIQMRARQMPDDELYAIAVEFVEVCRTGGALSIINDRADIAVATEADGLHIGQNDLPVEQIRRLLHRPMIIGKSTHAMDQLHNACADQVTYAALGPVFPTATKPNVQPVSLDYVRQATTALAHTGIGNVAIGGITVDNVEQVLQAGAASIAVCAAVTQAPNPEQASRQLKQKIEAFFLRQRQ